MRKISILALFVGGVVSFFSAAILAIPFGMLATLKVDHAKWASPTLLSEAVRSIILSTPGLYYGGVGIDCACCILGGYLAAVTARRNESLNGLAASLLFVAVEIFGMNQHIDPHPLPVHVLHVLGIVLGSWLGGYLRGAQVRKSRGKNTLDRFGAITRA